METLPHSGGLRVEVDGAQRGQPPPRIAGSIGVERQRASRKWPQCRRQQIPPLLRLQQQIEAQAARKPDQLVKEILRIVLSALACAIGFAFLAGVLPRGQGAGINRGVQEEYFEKLVK
jgi:hypothetical protein